MLTSLAVAAAMPPGVRSRIVDEEVEPVDFSAPADLVGVTFMTFNAPRAYEIADRFREERKLPVIMGGYHPSFMPQEALEHCDAVCIGDAEGNVHRMIEDFSAGRLRPTYSCQPIDLRHLRVPDRTLVDRSSYNLADAVQATRGCPNRCRFCSIASFHGNRFRARPVDEVIEEIRQLGPYLLFVDDNLTADRDYAGELFRRMIPLRKRWFSQCAVSIAHDGELLRLAQESGCRGLFLGLESISEEGLAGWGKGFQRAKDHLWAIERLHRAGIGVIAGVVFGGDHDGLEVFDRTLDFLRDADADALQATILTPFPGTPLFYEMEGQGRIVDRDWSKYDFAHAVFMPARMSRKELEAGHDLVLTRFYSRSSILRRLRRQLGYLSLPNIFTASFPLNLSYRSRLKMYGTIRS